jgi:hypothetical protein
MTSPRELRTAMSRAQLTLKLDGTKWQSCFDVQLYEAIWPRQCGELFGGLCRCTRVWSDEKRHRHVCWERTLEEAITTSSLQCSRHLPTAGQLRKGQVNPQVSSKHTYIQYQSLFTNSTKTISSAHLEATLCNITLQSGVPDPLPAPTLSFTRCW